MPIYNRLRAIRKHKGYTQKEVGEVIGAKPSTYADIEKGRIKIKAEDLYALADFFDVPMRYFYTNEEVHGMTEINSCPTNLDNDTIKIPVLGIVPAGIPIEAIENVLEYEEIPRSLAKTGTFFAFKISGDSMYPKYLDGDIIICKQQNHVKNGGEAIVYTNSDYDTTFKRVIFQNETINLESYNQAYPPITIKKEQLNVVAVPVELRRSL